MMREVIEEDNTEKWEKVNGDLFSVTEKMKIYFREGELIHGYIYRTIVKDSMLKSLSVSMVFVPYQYP